MSEVKFTKGEWVVVSGDNELSIDSEYGAYICDIKSNNLSFDQDKANARLISAAPDMYEFIKSLTLRQSFNEWDEHKARQALELLTKARGESNE